MVAVLIALAGCSAQEEPPELAAHLTIHVQKDDKSPVKSAVLICPGRTAHERDICAALDVVAPKVFEAVPIDRPCTMIYGGPATATVRGTYDEGLANAVLNQANGCEIARWNQLKPVFEALDLL